MIKDLSKANQYFLLPEGMGEPILVGGVGIMDILCTHIEDADIVADFGVTNTRCVLIVKIPREKCEDLILQSKKELDSSIKETL